MAQLAAGTGVNANAIGVEIHHPDLVRARAAMKSCEPTRARSHGELRGTCMAGPSGFKSCACLPVPASADTRWALRSAARIAWFSVSAIKSVWPSAERASPCGWWNCDSASAVLEADRALADHLLHFAVEIRDEHAVMVRIADEEVPASWSASTLPWNSSTPDLNDARSWRKVSGLPSVPFSLPFLSCSAITLSK